MATLESDALVLRAIRYGEADAVLSLYTRGAGRVSALAKGARRPRSRLGGRLQPAMGVRVNLHRGRGDMYTVRGAAVLDARAGLWVDGWRLQAASCLLEAVMRVSPEGEADEATWHLLGRALDALAASTTAPAVGAPARLHPLVLSAEVKLLVIAGLLPVLGACVRCGASPPLPAFSAAAGGALCAACAPGGEPVDGPELAGFAALAAHPLARAADVLSPGAAPGVERLIGLLLREHLGVRLRSAAAP